MRVIEVNKYGDFCALEEKWQDVLEQRNYYTVFSTWDWLSTWWKHLGKGKRLVLLMIEANDRIVGIAPFMYSVHKMFGIRMGKIEFVGTPDSDYADFILAEKSEECIKSFIEYLNNVTEKWKSIELSDVPENSKSLPTLRKISRNVKLIHKCPYTCLPKSQDTFLKSLGGDLRYDLNRGLRRLEEDGYKANFVDYSDSHSFNKGMRIFFELHQKRWTSKGFSGVYAEEKYRNFHLDIAKSFSQKGWLGLYSLELSGRPVSALYGFKYNQKFYFYLSGLDPAFYRYGVGKLLLAHVISQCIHQGLNEFDFLRGEAEYKNRWNTMTRGNSQATITRKGFLEDIEYQLYEKYWQQGNRLRYAVKKLQEL